MLDPAATKINAECDRRRGRIPNLILDDAQLALGPRVGHKGEETDRTQNHTQMKSGRTRVIIFLRSTSPCPRISEAVCPHVCNEVILVPSKNTYPFSRPTRCHSVDVDRPEMIQDDASATFDVRHLSHRILCRDRSRSPMRVHEGNPQPCSLAPSEPGFEITPFK